MGEENNIGGRVGLDITDFKANIAQLNREIRVIESGFKATAAGLADWGNTAEGLEGRISSLNKITDLQAKKIANLKAEYDRVVASKGADSKAAQDLQIKINKETAALNKNQLELKQVTIKLSELGKGMNQIESEAQQASKSLDGFSSNFRKLGGQISAVISGLATGVIASLGIQFNASMEQAEVGFATMIGDTKKAKKFLKQLTDFAKNTPFELEGLKDTSTMMMGFGFQAEDVIPTLKSVGDAVAAVGGGNDKVQRIVQSLGQIKATGRATWEEIKQMGENGIPALKMLADAFGVTEQKMMDMLSKGAVPADKAITILTDGMNKKYGGMMKNMEDKWDGMISSIKDGASILIGSAFKPVFSYIEKNVLPVIKDLIDKLQKGFDTNGIKGALAAIIPPGFKDEIKTIGDTINVLKTNIEDGNWGEFGKNLGKAFKEALNSLMNLGGDIGSKIKEVMGKVDWAEVGKNSVIGAVGFILGFAEGLLDPMVWWQIIKEHWDSILMLLIGVVAAPEALIGKLGTALAKIPLVGKFVAWLVEGISKIGKKALDPVWKFVKDMAGFLWQSFKGALDLKGPGIIPAIKRIINKAVESIKSFGTSFYNKAGELMIKVGEGLGSKGRAAIIKAKEIASQIGEGIKSIAGQMYEIGKNIIQGLINGISSMAKSLYNKAKSIASSIKNTIKDALDINSPSRVMANEIGKFIPEGLAMGIDKNLNSVIRASEKMGSAVVDYSHPQPSKTVTQTNTTTIAPSITVQSLVVREEADIDKIAYKLYKLQRGTLRAQGAR